jgi:corrinoid protein of di/trimethylamine methyltransferase
MSGYELFAAMTRSIVEGDEEDAERLAGEALAGGIEPLEAINRGFVPGLNEVGEAFSSREVFLPDLVRAGVAMKTAMGVLGPELTRRGAALASSGTVVIGTVKGDIHEIGKNLVATMMSANGFTVHDLGVDVPPESFIAKAKEVKADMVGLSALLTTTMPQQARVVHLLREARMAPEIKVIVGGASVTRDWVDKIGADGFSMDAVGAVQVAQDLLGVERIL